MIHGQKITVRFPGQQQTCARCYQTPQGCKGRGVAKRCEAAGGVRVEFTDYILELWKKIGYSPDKINFSEVINLETDQQDGGIFTPAKTSSPNIEKFTGVSIKQFPKEIDHGEIIEFIINCGLPEGKTENITINQKGTATVQNLNNTECLILIEAIHGK